MNTPFRADKARVMWHLRQAVELGSSTVTSRWLSVGHLAEAETSCIGLSCGLAKKIREARHEIEKGRMPEIGLLVNEIEGVSG